MTLDQLKDLRAAGKFHHATYREHGNMMEGLHIYAKQNNGFNGFTHVGAIFKDDPDLDAAYAEVRSTGVSFGAYGRG